MAAGRAPAPHLTPETGAGERTRAAQVTHAPCRASSLSVFRSHDMTIVSRIPCVIRHAFLSTERVNDSEGNSNGGSVGNNLQRREFYSSPVLITRRIDPSVFVLEPWSGVWNVFDAHNVHD